MCEFCSAPDESKAYMKSTYGDIYMVNFGNKKVLLFEPHICPPFARCVQKNIPLRIAFAVNYCPNCGAKMDGGKDDETG